MKESGERYLGMFGGRKGRNVIDIILETKIMTAVETNYTPPGAVAHTSYSGG